MSFQSWLQNLRSALDSSRHAPRDVPRAHHAERDGYVPRRRGSLLARIHRPDLEVLEDRRTLSLGLVSSFLQPQPPVPIEWSPAASSVMADFSGDGRLDLLTAEDQYWDGATLVNVFLGEPDGGYSLWQSSYVYISPTNIGVGDAFLGDGRLDVVFAGYGYNEEGFGFLVLGNDGDWGASVPLPPDQPRLSIDNATVTEGSAGLVAATFNVGLSAASSEPITVGYTTADGSAGYGNDYVAASGTLTFAPGETSKPVKVLVVGDTTFEPNEAFAVYLNSATGATIVDGQAVGTIVNDDVPLPMLNVSDVFKNEGHSGTTEFRFTVFLSAASNVPVTVQYATANGTAKVSGRDYDAKSGTLTFQPGETSKTVTVLVRGDRTREADETFFLNLANSQGAMIGDGQGLGMIENDDGSAFAALIDDLALSQTSRKRR